VFEAVLRIPFTFSNAEYADVVYVYGFCDGSAVATVTEYHRRFPNCRILDLRVFLPAFSTHCMRVVHFLVLTFHLNVKVNNMWLKWKTFFSWYSKVLLLVHKRISMRLGVP
jgi:hypothetical protein